MSTRVLGKPALLAGVLLLAVVGAAVAAPRTGQAPPGEPTIAGATYASGAGAAYLSTAGAPRKLSGSGIGALGGAAAEKAAAAGAAAGKAAGKKLKPLQLTVGY